MTGKIKTVALTTVLIDSLKIHWVITFLIIFIYCVIYGIGFMIYRFWVSKKINQITFKPNLKLLYKTKELIEDIKHNIFDPNH